MNGHWSIARPISLPLHASNPGSVGGFASMMRKWSARDLATRFALAATAVVGLLMIVLCWWVSGRIERGVIEYAVSRTALHVDALIEPHVQELAAGQGLSEKSRETLGSLMAFPGEGFGLTSLSVWSADGTPVFSSTPAAGSGAGLDGLGFAEARQGLMDGGALVMHGAGSRFRMTSPVHETKTGRVIAYAALEEDGSALADSLSGIRWQTLGVVGIVSLVMVGALFRIVKQGSRTIAQQRRDLAERVVSLSKLLDQNTELQARLQDVNRRSTDTNDRALRRIGAELHDGPVQLIALALLRLETLHHPSSDDRTPAELEEFDAIEAALRDALKEIRGLSAGLALPDLQGVPVAKAIEFAVMNHERRSRTRVKLDLAANLPAAADLPILACAYRLTQESLNNAVRHAGGKEQVVKGSFEDGVLRIEVSDKGPGLKPQRGPESEEGLGLIGLRDRLHSLGGTLNITSAPGNGTQVVAAIDLGAYERRDAAALSG